MTNQYIIIVAAGMGKRMNLPLPKQFYEIDNKAILQYALENAKINAPNAEIILVLHSDYIQYWEEYCQKKKYTVDYQIISGGEERYFSVKNALNLLKDKEGTVAIQDGVRLFVPQRIWTQGFILAKEKGSAIPILPMVDSMVQQSKDGFIPVPRNNYKRVQAPQFFNLDLLYSAYFEQAYQPSFTDDASVFYALGRVSHALYMFEGDEINKKITYREDL